MPVFSHQSADLERLGLLLDLHVALPSDDQFGSARAGAIVTARVAIGALVDTGASNTVLSHSVIVQLGIQPLGIAYVAMPAAAAVACAVYRARLEFSPTVQIELNVIAATLHPARLDCLIGRDVLARAVFTYDGPRGRFRLRF